MLNAVSEFILKDSFPLQLCLHSIPAVNIVIKLFQNQSENIVGSFDAYNAKRERFQTIHMAANLLQAAVAITAFALCILLPAFSSVLALVALGFGAGALTSYLMDLFLNKFGSERSNLDNNGYWVMLKGL